MYKLISSPKRTNIAITVDSIKNSDFLSRYLSALSNSYHVDPKDLINRVIQTILNDGNIDLTGDKSEELNTVYLFGKISSLFLDITGQEDRITILYNKKLEGIKESFVNNFLANFTKHQRKILKDYVEASNLELFNFCNSYDIKFIADDSLKNKDITKSNKTARRSEKLTLSKEVKEMNKSNLTNLCKDLPEHVHLIQAGSAEFAELCENQEGLLNAYNITKSLINGTEHLDKRYNTFVVNGKPLHQNAVISEVYSILKRTADPSLMKIEESFIPKVGKVYSLPYYKWHDKVVSIFKEVKFNPDTQLLQKAINIVFDEILQESIKYHNDNGILINDKPLEGIFPLKLDAALEKTTKSRNSGLPFASSKWATDKNMLEHYLSEAELALEGEYVWKDIPRILFKRTKADGAQPKMRQVLCPPKSEAIAAKGFTYMFTEIMKRIDKYCGFKGNTNISDEMKEFLKFKNLLSSDISSFDTNIKHLIPLIFDAIKEITPSKYNQYFDNLKHYYTNAKVITPLGILYSDETNGLCSGDGWTSIIGTLANAIAQEYFILRSSINSSKYSVFGDDVVFVSNDEIDISKYKTILEELGLEINLEKQELSDSQLNFLAFYYFKKDIEKEGSIGIFPIFRALPGFLYYETFLDVDKILESIAYIDEDLKEEIANTKKIGIELLGHVMRLNNLINHPSFYDFLDLFILTEPNNMNPDLILPYNNLANEVKIIRGSKSGIIDSKVMQYIMDITNDTTDSSNNIVDYLSAFFNTVSS